MHIGMRSGGSKIPIAEKAMLKDACFPEGMPSFLEWGCQFSEGANTGMSEDIMSPWKVSPRTIYPRLYCPQDNIP